MPWYPNEIADEQQVAAYGATFTTAKIEPQKYFTTYLRIAAQLSPAASVCEIGVWQGESLRMWQALFPLGTITGVDRTATDREWPPGTRQIIAAQDDTRLPAMLTETGAAPLDLIVDDASHEGGKTAMTFALLWPLLAPGGFYVIEDWHFGFTPGQEAMLTAAMDLIRGLDAPDSDCEYVIYRWGMAIARKRRIA